MMRWRGQKRSSSEDAGFDCQNPSPSPNSNLDSLLPSSEFSELFPPADGYNNDDTLIFLTGQDEQNNIATSNDDMDSLSIFSTQNDVSSDDLISSNIDYDAFLQPNEAFGSGGGGVNGGHSNFGDDIAMFTDQDLFSNAV